jgi:hypothetical protein
MTRLVFVAAVSFAFLLSPQLLRTADDKETQKMKDQIEILEAKLELLKKENELLKKEIELLKKGGAGEKPDPDKKGEVLKTTVNGVEYEIISSKMNGKAWELTVGATSKEGEKKVQFEKFRAFTDDGKVIDIRGGLMKEPLTLPEGTLVQTTYTLNGPLANSKKATSIELHQNEKAKSDAVVFKNVPLAR